MSNFLIARAGAGKFGAVGAIEAASIDVGAIEAVEFGFTQDVNTATDASHNDMVVEVALGAPQVSLKLTLQEFTAANVSRALGLVADGSGNMTYSGDNTAPTYFTGYFHGFKLDGNAKILHIIKGFIKPGALLSLGGNDQKKLEVEVTCMVDPGATGAKVFEILSDTADVTAPSVASIVPADAATAVAKAITTTVAWTFDAAIRSEDVTADKFIIHDPSGDAKAGTLSVNGTNTVVTFTPTTAWTATTIYTTLVVGVRDVAGNKLAAPSGTIFTTGS